MRTRDPKHVPLLLRQPAMPRQSRLRALLGLALAFRLVLSAREAGFVGPSRATPCP